MIPMMATRIETATDSKRLHLDELRKGIIGQSTRAGTITTDPAASASHQVDQVAIASEEPGWLVMKNPARTMAELIIVVGAKEIMANFAIPEGVSNVWRPFEQRTI